MIGLRLERVLVKTLLIDIETSPNLAYVWSLFNQDVALSQIHKTTEVICFAAKWQGERKMYFASVHEDGKDAMVLLARDLLDEADVVMHYNGKRFDIPHLNREILLAGLTPPAPFQQIDLYSVVKRRFKFQSGKLAHVAKQLGLAGKVKHEGFELWVKCMMGQKTAWKTMKRYNKQDVHLLEDVYERLQPWVPNHPSRTLYDGAGDCPVCGHDRLQRRGYAYTKVSKYQRWQCQGCGAWLRSGKRSAGLDIRQAATS